MTTFTIKKRESSPDFVWGSFGCKLEDLKDFVNDKGYVNFDILKGKEGGYYAKINEYGLKNSTSETVVHNQDVLKFKEDEEIPF